MKKTKALLIAYASGYFDGEGCIYSRTEEGKRYGNIAMGIDSRYDKVPLDLIRSLFGGKVFIRWSNRDLKCFYHWYLQDSKLIKRSLKLMYPFLKTKKMQAEIAIRLADRILVGIHQNKSLSVHEKQTRSELTSELKRLKTTLPSDLTRAETERKDNIHLNVETTVRTLENKI